jgi:hypothetical protein
MEMNTLADPARFADAIRSLAQDAHQTLRRSSSPAALRRLSRRIERLSDSLGDLRGAPLGAWLDNLASEVQSATVHRTGAFRPTCQCA